MGAYNSSDVIAPNRPQGSPGRDEAPAYPPAQLPASGGQVIVNDVPQELHTFDYAPAPRESVPPLVTPTNHRYT